MWVILNSDGLYLHHDGYGWTDNVNDAFGIALRFMAENWVENNGLTNVSIKEIA